MDRSTDQLLHAHCIEDLRTAAAARSARGRARGLQRPGSAGVGALAAKGGRGRLRITPYAWALPALLVLALSLSACGGGGEDNGRPAIRAAAPVDKAEAGNWNFETGDFTDWSTRSRGSGAWHVYENGATPPDPTDSDSHYPFKVPEPPEGKFAAVTDMSDAGTRILYRDAVLDGRYKLRLTLFYENHVTSTCGLSSPATLDFRDPRPNQQFRIDLVDPGARLGSLAAKDVLATIFRTARGDPGRLGPRTVGFDLSRWAGQKVRLRFAQVDNRGPLRGGVDDVRLEAAGD